MKINATLPFDQIDQREEFLSVEAVAEIGLALERASFDGGNVTDHPSGEDRPRVSLCDRLVEPAGTIHWSQRPH